MLGVTHVTVYCHMISSARRGWPSDGGVPLSETKLEKFNVKKRDTCKCNCKNIAQKKKRIFFMSFSSYETA